MRKKLESAGADAASFVFRPVSSENWKDFEALFESRGGPKYCWCMAWRSAKEELKDSDTRSRKRNFNKRVSSGTPVGLLAYDNDVPVAWCSVAPRDSYRNLGGDDALENVWSIVCFFIRRDYRRQGLTAAFIEEATHYARRHGAGFLAAYPVEKGSPSYRFMGFKQTFERQGFTFVKKAGTRRNVMIRRLR